MVRQASSHSSNCRKSTKACRKRLLMGLSQAMEGLVLRLGAKLILRQGLSQAVSSHSLQARETYTRRIAFRSRPPAKEPKSRETPQVSIFPRRQITRSSRLRTLRLLTFASRPHQIAVEPSAPRTAPASTMNSLVPLSDSAFRSLRSCTSKRSRATTSSHSLTVRPTPSAHPPNMPTTATL